jgi:hypothetical protein
MYRLYERDRKSKKIKIKIVKFYDNSKKLQFLSNFYQVLEVDNNFVSNNFMFFNEKHKSLR